MKLKNKEKKAEGLSLSVVVIAAVALVVLIVLILVFSGRLGLFNTGVKSCPPGSDPLEEIELDEQGMCPGGKLPVKVVGEGDNLNYCCQGSD